MILLFKPLVEILPEAVLASMLVFSGKVTVQADLPLCCLFLVNSSFNTRVVVTAGIHWDNLSEEGIQKVIRNSRILLDLIVDRIKAETSPPATGGKS